MKRLTLLFAMATIAITMQYTMPSTVSADTISLQTLCSPMLLADTQGDQPVVHPQSSWGALKMLYRGNVSQSNLTEREQASTDQFRKPGVTPMNATDRSGFPWQYGDWTSGVLYEARFALSSAYRNGTSQVLGSNGVYYGDWDYVNSDPFARDAAKAEAFQQWGYHIGSYDGHFSGGTCTWFVRLVLYRATYGANYGSHLTTPNYPNTVWSWCDWKHMTRIWDTVRGGFVGSSPYNHMLIFEKRATFNGKIGWWVIDSNFVGTSKAETIGKHFMSDDALNSGNYWAWLPSWATTK